MNYYNLSLLLNNEEKGYEYARISLVEFKQLMEKYPDYEEKCVVFLHLAYLYERLNELEKAIEIYKKALVACKNDEARVWYLSGIATIYRDKCDYKKSEESYKQALMIAKDEKILSNIYFDIGKMYFESNRKQEASEAFSNALYYREYDPVLKNNKEYLADIYWHLGTLVYYNNDYDKAIEYLNKTLEDITENHIYYSNTHITLGHCYFAKGDFTKAQEHYNVALFSPLATEEEKNMANECLKNIEKEYKA